jgi:Tfp pilus assembly pilus retraction ATPase PilT
MIDNIIQTSADVGMMSLETSLAIMVQKGLVTEQVAFDYALRPSEFQNKLRSIKQQ